MVRDVLDQASEAHLVITKLALDHTERMLNLGANLGLGLLDLACRFVQAAPEWPSLKALLPSIPGLNVPTWSNSPRLPASHDREPDGSQPSAAPKGVQTTR